MNSSSMYTWLILFVVMVIASFVMIPAINKKEKEKGKEMDAKGYMRVGNQWVPKQANQTTTTKVITEDNTGSPLEILQKRLVRGEITGEEYDELKTKMDNTDNTATPMKILQQRLARGEIKLDEFNRLHGRM